MLADGSETSPPADWPIWTSRKPRAAAAIAAAAGGPPCDSQLVARPVGHRDAEVGRARDPLGEAAVAGEPEAVREQVHASPVGRTAHALAARNERKRGMAAEVAARADVDVDRIQ